MVLSNKDLAIFYNCSEKTAITRKREILTYFKIRSGRVFIHHLSKYESVSECEILKTLYPMLEIYIKKR